MYNEEKADRAVKFIKLLKHTKGDFGKKPFELMEWEEKIIRDLFGTINGDGKRQYREAYISMGRKNGKTELAGAMALYCLFSEGEYGAEIYCNAGDTEQASMVYKAAATMTRLNPTLDSHAKILDSNKRIVYEKQNSFLRVLSHEAETKHGLNPYFVVNDELHVWPNRRLYTAMRTGFGARLEPLMINITTAGYDRESLCYELYDYAKKVQKGLVNDPTFYVAIWELDEEDDWKDEQNWYKANPGLGHHRYLDDMRKEFKRAIEIPSEENEFKRLYLNAWTQQRNRYISLEKWLVCQEKFEFNELSDSCYIGVDMASRSDIAAVVVVIPDDKDFLNIQPFFFIPEDNIALKGEKNRQLYETWVRQGFMTATPGNQIDFTTIEEKIKEIAITHQVSDIVYDEWEAIQMAQRLSDIGLPITPMRQIISRMSAPTKELLSHVLSGRIRHNHNPVLSWMVDNLVVYTDPSGNVRPVKNDRDSKIDGVVATIMALDSIMRKPNQTSVYDKRGLLYLEPPVPEEKKEPEVKTEEETEKPVIQFCPRCNQILTGNICEHCGRIGTA